MEKINERDPSEQIIEAEAQSEEAIISEGSEQLSPGENIKAAKKGVQEQFSSVAISADRRKLIAVFSLAVVGILVYFLFFSGEPSSEKQKDDYDKKIEANKVKIVKESISLPKVSENENKTVAQPVNLPDPLPISDPVPPSPPPPPIPLAPPTPIIINNDSRAPLPPFQNPINGKMITNPSAPFNSEADDRKKILDQKRKAGIMVTGSGKGGVGSSQAGKDDKGSEDKAVKKPSTVGFLGFGNGSLDKERIQKSSAPQVIATKVSNLDRTILQGKVIYSILETAINTDIPGTLRAIVSRDVYSESGNNVLVPKGSRLIGSYEAQIKPGQTRVNIMWSRLIRPDGVDIEIGSAGTDQLGRAGVMGHVDNKFWTQLSNAFLVSYLIPVGTQQLMGSKGQITQSESSPKPGDDPVTSTTGSAKDLALKKGSEDFSKLASDAVKNSFSTTPTMTIEQGTIVNILVQKDLIFPAGSMQNGAILQ